MERLINFENVSRSLIIIIREHINRKKNKKNQVIVILKHINWVIEDKCFVKLSLQGVKSDGYTAVPLKLKSYDPF